MVAFSGSGATLFAAKSIKVLIYKKLSESIEKKGTVDTVPGGDYFSNSERSIQAVFS